MDVKEARRLYERIWRDEPAYRGKSGSKYFALKFLDYLNGQRSSIIEWGCGEGRAADLFVDEGFDPVIGIDIAANCIDGLDPRFEFVPGAAHEIEVGPVDYSFSNDLLEHIPEQYIEASVKNIMDHTLVLAFMHISTSGDSWGTRFGPELHCLIRPPIFWIELFAPYGEVKDLGKSWGCSLVITKEG